jgi:membrane-bound lytic murein transglycosylase D
LPRETREYVPQLIAAAAIAQNPELYGLGDIEDVSAFEFIKVNVPGGMPLKAIAKAASIDVSSIKSLNPEIRRGITPLGKNYGSKLPSETDTVTFHSSLSEILHKEKRVLGAFAHRIGRPDTARKIIKRYGVSKEDLTLVNGKSISFKKGALVYIPRFENTKRAKAKTADFRRKTSGESFQDEGNTGTASYVKKEEAQPGIKAKSGKGEQSIKHDNRMKTPRIKRKKKPSLASYSNKTSRKAPEIYHWVQRGDTLWRIANKYGKSVETIKTMNNLKGNEIRRGMRLRVSSFFNRTKSLSAQIWTPGSVQEYA